MNDLRNKSQMHALLLLSSKEVLWSWAWMNDVLAYQSPNPHPTTPPIVARWLSRRQFLGQTTLISHYSLVNEVVSNATDNQILWSWHLFTVFTDSYEQQSAAENQTDPPLEPLTQTEALPSSQRSCTMFSCLQLCGNSTARSRCCGCTRQVLSARRAGELQRSPSSAALLNNSDS